MDGKKIYTFKELSSMGPDEAERIFKAIQEEAIQNAYVIEDMSKRFFDQLKEKDSEIARLREENEALLEKMEILEAALGSKNAILKVRNSERFGRSTEKLRVFLSGLLSGMGEQEKAGIMDKLSGMLSDPSTQEPCPGKSSASRKG